MIVCRRMNIISSSVEGTGLFEDRVRHRGLADVVEGGGLRERGHAPLRERPRWLAVRWHSSVTSVRWAPRAGSRSASMRSSTSVLCLPGGCAAGALARVHPLVGEAQRLGRRHGSRSAAAPIRRRRVMVNAVPCSVSAAAAVSRIMSGRPASTVASTQNSSPPMRYALPTRAWPCRQVAAEPHEQRVADRVPERVVVSLEAVEVEDASSSGRSGEASRRHCSRSRHQAAAVRQAGERVAQGGVLQLALR